MIAKAWWFSIVIIVGVLLWLGWWAQQVQTVEVLRITTPSVGENTVPVYAQFDITQSVIIHEPRVVSQIVIPFRVPLNPTGELRIDVQQNRQLLQRWRIRLDDYTNRQNQAVELALDLLPTRLLQGPLEITLAAPHLDAHFPERAPQVFIESADQGYADGNYRIAENPKKGDMGLTVKGNRSNWELYRERWHKKPTLEARKLTQWVLVILLVSSFSWIWRQQPTHT